MNLTEEGGFRPIPNPYIVGNPIKDPGMFFGREDDFAYVQKKFSGGKEGGIVVLCGTRRSGKTSVLFQVRNGRLGEDFLPVLIDMQSMAIRNEKDFLSKLAQEIVAAIRHPDISTEDFFANVIDNPYSAFESLIKKINLRMADKRLILLFDEYELFETNIDSGIIDAKVLNLLASLVEHKRVFIVFTGSDNLKARNKPYWEIFLTKALHRRITFLSRDDTIRLVRKPVEGVVCYDEGIPEEVFRLTAGQPFYTQVLCQTVVDHLNEYRRYNVSSEDVRQVVDEIIQNPLPQMIFNWNVLADLEKLSLAIIAEISKEEPKPVSPKDILAYAGREKIGYRIDANELNKVLEGLFHSDVLNKETGAEAYSFKMDLWRLWVGRMHSVWQVIDEIERNGAGSPGKGIYSEAIANRRRRRMIVLSVAAGIVSLAAVYWIFVRGAPGSGVGPVAMANLSVQTNPERATVFVDEKRIGPSPVDRARVPAASKLLRIELAGYRAIIDTLALGIDESREVSYDLTELTGDLAISSDPPGASITVDGSKTQLATPATLKGLSANALHRVELTLAGYQLGVKDGLRIFQDSTTSIRLVLGKFRGTLSIVSEPTEADAYIDGVSIGKTPCFPQDILYGPHTLKITKSGYSDYVRTLDVSKPNDKIEASLVTLPPGKLIFTIEPYASVTINGQVYEEDMTHREIELPPGKYTIILKHPSFPEYQTEVELRSNESIPIHYKFSK